MLGALKGGELAFEQGRGHEVAGASRHALREDGAGRVKPDETHLGKVGRKALAVFVFEGRAGENPGLPALLPGGEDAVECVKPGGAVLICKGNAGSHLRLAGLGMVVVALGKVPAGCCGQLAGQVRLARATDAHDDDNHAMYLILRIEFCHIGEEFGRGPLIAGVELNDFAVGSDEGRRKCVSDGLVGFAGEADVEEPGECGQGELAGNSEIPVSKCPGREGAHVGFAVGFQAGGGIAFGIKAGAEQVGLSVELWARCERFLEHSKVAGDAGTEVGQGALGVDEGDEQRLASELGEVDGVAVLIGEVKVGNAVAGGGYVELSGGAVVGFGLTDDDNVIDEDGGIGGLRNEHVGSEDIAGVEFADDAGVAKFVGHGHGVHEARNGLVVESDFASGQVGRDDFAAQGIGLELGRSGWSGVAGMAAGGGESEQEKEGGKGAIHTLVYRGGMLCSRWILECGGWKLGV